MKRLALIASLFLTACASSVPKVVVEPRAPVVVIEEPTYLVWSRTDARDGTMKYETVLLSSNGDELGRRDGVFVANGESLYEVRITQEKVPSLACNTDLWNTPTAELPSDAFVDQVFEQAEIIDVGTGVHRAPIGHGPALETNEAGTVLDVGESHVKIVGSMGSSLSFVEIASQWPCGTMHESSETIHAFDAATGKPADFGTCSDQNRELAEKQMGEGLASDWTVGEVECAGVTVELDEHHRLVANQHYEAYVTPEYGMNGWLATDERPVTMPGNYETDTPVVVGIFYDAHPHARGYSIVDSSTARALFTRS